MYLAAIAAGVVYHSARISSQTDGALLKALKEFIRDDGMPEELRELADMAFLSIQNDVKVNHKNKHKKKK